MWPYINQEDLIKPNNLLLFLNSRGRNSPATFAAADLEAMHVGMRTGAIVPPFLKDYIMLIRQATSPEKYGQLIRFDNPIETVSWMVNGKDRGAGIGLLILEAQAGVMSFLVKCAKGILHDIAIHDLLQSPLQPEPPLITKAEIGLASLADLREESPYKVPYQVDFSRIESLLSAKRNQVADHIWSLREDPGYFNEHIRDLAEHRRERMKDENGRAHPGLRDGREGLFWGRVVRTEVNYIYIWYEKWSELHDQSTKLKAMHAEHEAKIDFGGDLPEAYKEALVTFKYWGKKVVTNLKELLKNSVVTSPPWRFGFVREPVSDPAEAHPSIQFKEVKMSKIQKRLLWLLQIIWDVGICESLISTICLIDELQRVTELSKEAAEMFTPYVAGIIADLSLVTECLHQIGRCQPWGNTLKLETLDRHEELTNDYNRRTQTSVRIGKALEDDAENPFSVYGNPTKIEFRYPIDKRRTRDNVAAMRLAEANLDEFWDNLDKFMHQKVGDMRDTTMHALLAERRLQRTPEWIELDKEVADRDGNNIVQTSKSLSELYLDLEQRTEQTISKHTISCNPKTKEKTRGKTRPDGSSSNSENDTLDPQPIFYVDARALKVFKTLFFAPCLSATPGQVPWIDFLHAMVSIGFRAEKLYGSVWQFDPVTLDVKESIHFHEPHPSGKIPYLIARRQGRRLSKAYGWHGDMFELTKKEVC